MANENIVSNIEVNSDWPKNVNRKQIQVSLRLTICHPLQLLQVLEATNHLFIYLSIHYFIYLFIYVLIYYYLFFNFFI